MKAPIFLAAALLALPASAGTRIELLTTDLVNNSTGQSELLLDATRFRVNDSDSSLIFLTSDGRKRVLMLDKQRNEYTEMDQQTVDRLAGQMQGMAAQMEQMMKDVPPEQRAMMEQMMKGQMPQQAQAPARTVYTARGADTVGGIRCTNYEGVKGRQKVAEVCAADAAALKLGAADYQVFEQMREFMSSLTEAMQSMPMAPAMDDVATQSGFEGFPVRRITYRNGKAVEREELKSMAAATFTDADFSTGKARKVKMN